MNLNVKISRVFRKNFNATTKIVVNQGSSRSGKTYSILQLLILVKANEEKDVVFTIVRKTMPSLKASAIRDFFERSDGINKGGAERWGPVPGRTDLQPGID
jgi:phage terminase large subunit